MAGFQGPVRIVRETPQGAFDGVNVMFTVLRRPHPDSEEVFLDGMLMAPGLDADYTIEGASLTMATAPDPGSRLLVSYVCA